MTKLYSAEWCVHCQPVKQLIKEQNYDVEIVDVDIVGIDNIKAMGVKTIPTLEKNDGSLLPESSAITEFLKENF